MCKVCLDYFSAHESAEIIASRRRRGGLVQRRVKRGVFRFARTGRRPPFAAPKNVLSRLLQPLVSFGPGGLTLRERVRFQFLLLLRGRELRAVTTFRRW